MKINNEPHLLYIDDGISGEILKRQGLIQLRNDAAEGLITKIVCYDPDRPCVLDYAFLSTIAQKADSYIIYADRCMLSREELLKFGITFKKIPRDIARL